MSHVKKLNGFLERIDFFVTLIQMLWGVLVSCAIFVEYESFVMDVPFIAVIAGTCLCVAVSVLLQKRLIQNPKKTSAMAAYQIYNYGLPVLVCVLRFCFLDVLYGFHGSFMPGLAALGLAIVSIILVGIVLVGLAIFWITWFVRRRMEKKGRVSSGLWKKVKYVLNVVCFWGIVAAVAVSIIGVGVESLLIELQHRETKQNQVYLEKRLASLSADAESKDLDDIAWDLMADGYVCDLMVEIMAKDSVEDLEGDALEGMVADVNTLLNFSHVTTEVLEQGKEDYLEFTKRYVPVRRVETINQEIAGDAKAKTVSVSAELSVHDVQENMYCDAYMVTIFDENWNVIKVECRTERLYQ